MYQKKEMRPIPDIDGLYLSMYSYWNIFLVIFGYVIST